MLVCTVSARARRVVAAITAEAGTAADVVGMAGLGQLVSEAASAAESLSATITGVPAIIAADISETVTVVSTEDATVSVPDPFFSSTKLLMGFNGANGSTGAPGMTDESSALRGNATVLGACQIDTSQFKFGESSLRQQSSDYITFPDSADWDFGTGPFTMEGWFRFNTFSPANCVLFAQWSGGWAFYFEAGALKFRSGSATDTTAYTWSPTLNQWYHIAVDRDASSVARIYTDGVMRTKTTSYTQNLTGSSAALAIGSLRVGGFTTYDLTGHVDEIRITKGVARYGSDSGYTVPTAAFPRS